MMRREQVVHSGETCVDQINQSDEGNQHRGDVEREVQAVNGAARERAERVRPLSPFPPFRRGRR